MTCQSVFPSDVVCRQGFASSVPALQCWGLAVPSPRRLPLDPGGRLSGGFGKACLMLWQMDWGLPDATLTGCSGGVKLPVLTHTACGNPRLDLQVGRHHVCEEDSMKTFEHARGDPGPLGLGFIAWVGETTKLFQEVHLDSEKHREGCCSAGKRGWRFPLQCGLHPHFLCISVSVSHISETFPDQASEIDSCLSLLFCSAFCFFFFSLTFHRSGYIFLCSFLFSPY